MEGRPTPTSPRSRSAGLRSAAAALVALLAVGGCAGGGTAQGPSVSATPPSPSLAAASSPSSTVGVATAAPSTGSPTPATATPQPTPAASVTGVGVTLYFETSDIPDASAQTELVTASGRHVYVDLLNTSAEARKPTADDVLLITHFHPDHEDPSVIDAFPGKKLVAQPGSISLPDVRVTSVPAAHTEGDPMTDKDATDFIFVIEVGGLRIAHFGDLGQARLTPDQMLSIGRVDVAISQLQNPYSGMDEGSSLGFDQMRQVNPRLFIPTHLWGSEATAKAAAKAWPALVTTKPSIHLTAASLPAATTVLFMGLNAQQFGKPLKLKQATW